VTTAALLDELRMRHITISVRPCGVLNVEPRSAVDADLAAEIRAHKEDLVVTLMTEKKNATKGSQAQRLAALVDDEDLFRAADRETAFATIPVNDHTETWAVRSKGFKRWLVRRFYMMEEKPPSAQAISDALGAFEARAQFGGRVHDVYVRLAGVGDAIYLDLANTTWEAVEVTAAGWRVVADPPVRFRRAKGMLPLPYPVAGGSLAELRPFVNVRDDAQWALVAAWLIAAARPDGPYPVLVIVSEHGTAKSTSTEVLRRLIDPNCAMLRAEPRDVRDVMIAATNSWIVAVDNVSSLEPWLSDCLCRLSTGGGFATRELYTDQDEVIFLAQRPVVLNGIEEIVTRSDLLDRSLLVELPLIPEDRRQRTSEFWRAFEAAQPRLLGALLDAVSTGLRRERQVQLARLPRMADFAVWATAAAPALGWSDDTFINAYMNNRSDAHEVALDVSPVAAVIRILADQRDWTGTSAELLEELTQLADEAIRRAKSWPATPRQLGAILRRLAPNLRAVGVEVGFRNQRELGARRRQVVVQKVRVFQRSHRSDGSDAGLDDGLAFPGTMDRSQETNTGNDETARGNNGNDGNGPAAVLSDDEEAIL